MSHPYRPLNPDPNAPLDDAELLRECQRLLGIVARHRYARKLLLGVHAQLKLFAEYKKRPPVLQRSLPKFPKIVL